MARPVLLRQFFPNARKKCRTEAARVVREGSESEPLIVAHRRDEECSHRCRPQFGWLLARIFHSAQETPTACSRRRRRTRSHAWPHPPPHVGGYDRYEISRLEGKSCRRDGVLGRRCHRRGGLFPAAGAWAGGAAGDSRLSRRVCLSGRSTRAIEPIQVNRKSRSGYRLPWEKIQLCLSTLSPVRESRPQLRALYPASRPHHRSHRSGV